MHPGAHPRVRHASATYQAHAGDPVSNEQKHPGNQSVILPEETLDLPTRVLTTVARLIREHGYESFTVQDAAQAARVGKRTIYALWPTKSLLVRDSLLNALFNLAHPVKATPVHARALLQQWLQTTRQALHDPANASLVSAVFLTMGDENGLRSELRGPTRLTAPLYNLVDMIRADDENASRVPAATIVDGLIGAVVLELIAPTAWLSDSAESTINMLLGHPALSDPPHQSLPS